jgi:hypothetical protein
LLRHLYHLTRATIWLTLTFVRAAWYFRRRALQDLALPHPEAMDSKEKRRLQHYFYGTTYLSVVFCALRGHGRSRREKHVFTNLAALAYFFDDLVDAFRHRDDTGLLWENNPEQYGRAADERGLALHFLRNVYCEIPAADLPQFRDFMHRVFNVETAGRQAKWSDSVLLMTDLMKITAEKGGYSVLMFRRALAHPLSAAEQSAIFEFGYLIQLCDDIFDLWFDRQARISTLATTLAEAGRVVGLLEIFERQVAATRRAFRAAGAGERAATAYCVVHFIVGITRVCLAHYAHLERKHGRLPLDSRGEMVVDMERWGNRIRTGWYLLKAG